MAKQTLPFTDVGKSCTSLEFIKLLLSCQAKVTVTSCLIIKLPGFRINRSLVYWIGLIHARFIDSRYLKWSVLNNCKQNITPLSLLVGTTVMLFVKIRLLSRFFFFFFFCIYSILVVSAVS